ncbi:MAG: hypothetical protein ACTS6J_25580 [Burkholderiales bacterium]
MREALRAWRVERLIAVRETLAANPLPPMTSEEIQAEIDDYRAQSARQMPDDPHGSGHQRAGDQCHVV